MMRAMKYVGGCLLLLAVLAPKAAAQEESIAAARELYAAAEYENALTLLNRLANGSQGVQDKQSIDLYRTLCLIAVGRQQEADRAIETMITNDPLYRPGDDLSPKMRSVFTEARKRVLPGLIQQNYHQAKAAFDRQEFVVAASGFKRVVDTLADPDVKHLADQPPLSDIRTLASGFHDLSVKAIPPPAPPLPVEAAVVVPKPLRIYTVDDRQVAAPVVIQQELPGYRGLMKPGGMSGAVEVIINEMGFVEESRIVVSLGKAYDEQLASAVRRWQYYPARADGKPVKYRKRIQINVAQQ